MARYEYEATCLNPACPALIEQARGGVEDSLHNLLHDEEAPLVKALLAYAQASEAARAGRPRPQEWVAAERARLEALEALGAVLADTVDLGALERPVGYGSMHGATREQPAEVVTEAVCPECGEVCEGDER